MDSQYKGYPHEIAKSRFLPKVYQNSVIRNIEDKNFDYLVAVSFDTGFSVTEAYLIPVDVLLDQLDYNEYQNGYLLKLSQFNLNDGRIKDIKELLIS